MKHELKHDMQAQQGRSALGILGALAITLGIFYLVDFMLGSYLSANFWPLHLIVPGVLMSVGALFMDEKNGVALSIAGSVTAVTGFVFLIRVLTGYGAHWAYSWALIYPAAVGFGLLAYGLTYGQPKLNRLGWTYTKIGLGLFVVLAIFFEAILGLGGFAIGYGWLMLVITLGLFVLLMIWEFGVKQTSIPSKKADAQNR